MVWGRNSVVECSPVSRLAAGSNPAVLVMVISRIFHLSMIPQVYTYVLVYFIGSVLLSAVILAASYLMANQAPDTQKLTAYECGFDAFDDARSRFDVRFYLVSILFIVFDLEATYLFPWSVSLGDVGSLGFWTMIDFVIELTIGYIYAWKMGALEWSLFRVLV